MIHVILVEPETPGNIGAVARVMANFNFSKLVLIAPKCSHLDQEARNRAKHAQSILKNANVGDKSLLQKFDYLIATTARTGTDYNIPRSPLTPREFAEKLAEIVEKNRKRKNSKTIGIVIGRESTGLYNNEIEQCDFCVTIPACKKYPTLNISHAVSIILYEIYQATEKENSTSHITPIGKAEKEQLNKMFNRLFDKLEWQTKEKKQTQQLLWKKIIGKAMLTKREAFGVMGLLRKVITKKE
jgi:TrmH family RNA methyltransferase